jgi:predicted metal-dependent enzyme (double-stranded beta helix superfamily)
MTSLLLGSQQLTSRSSGPAKIAHPHGLLDGVTDAIDMGTSELLAIARELAHDAVNWHGLREPARRVWELIDSSQDFEAWVIGWPPGEAIELHDHGESGGAVVVAEGELVEMVIKEDGNGTLALANTVLPTSASVTFDRSHIHEIVNLGPGPAVSIHVYAPRLTAMTYYEFSGGILEARATVRYRLGTAIP